MNLLNLFNSQPKTINVSSVKYKKALDDQLVNKLNYFLQSANKDLSKQGYSRIMVRISEDVNSLAAGKLLQTALGDKVIAIIFDFEETKINYLVEICKKLGLNTFILKRNAAYQNEISAYKLHKHSDIKNFYQRFINYHLLIQAEIMKAAVVDTIDKSNRLLGTRPEGFYGQFMPFYSLYKTEIYELAKFLGLSQYLPSDDYWKKIDPILYLLTEKQMKPEEISQQYDINLHWLKKLKSCLDKQLLKSTTSQFII